ncbi:cation-translocating P-type ATPase [Rhodosalinus halophilus]|nr:HAD-IC family P-type ATPase [Rhodosalinus halophilus]
MVNGKLRLPTTPPGSLAVPRTPPSVSLAHRTAGGRVRLRCPALRNRPERAQAAERHLGAVPGVRTAEVRATTGSVILQLAGPLSDAEVLAAVQATLAAPSCRTRPRATRRAAETGPAWHGLSAEEALTRVATDATTGLSDEEARARLARLGANRLPGGAQRSQAAMLAEQFQSLPVAMLLGSAAVSVATGGAADAAATIAVVLINAALGYVTEGQAEASISKLMDSSEEAVTVLRDGTARTLPARELVPGDLVEMHAGRVIAADARLVAARRLRVDESALTGETLPVTKLPDAQVDEEAPLGERPTMLHSGTLVAEGEGRAVVVATGPRTVAARIAEISERATRPRAPVETELDRMGGVLAKLAFGACGVFLGIGWLRGMSLAEMLKDSLALAVAAVPEGLPVVATTTMSLGLRRMERRGVLVRRVDTVESLGALQILCLDKTGTLTRNRLEVVEVLAGPHPDDPEIEGAREMLMQAAALNSEAEAGQDGAEGSSATERALLERALTAGVDVAALRAARPLEALHERRPERPYMVTQHGGAGPAVFVKGAPEAVLAQCAALWDGTPLDDALRSRILAANDLLAARPARVLAFAAGDAPPEDGVPRAMRWLGIMAMVDPLRPGARDFIAAMHRAGLRTIMITGDQAATAAAIARELDLAQGGPLRIIDSPEVAAMDPALLGGVAAQAHVFSRVSAAQKLAIVQALQQSGAVVGMTGDGVNDGPALKAANVGIAMGASGTDLARDVANVVIRDDELETLVDAIAQGRAVYRNIRRALEFLIATNLSEILVGMVEAAHGPGEIESPMELLWINLVSDVLPGLGLALADPDPDAMTRPPRAPDEPVIPPEHFRRMTLDAGTIAAASLVSHFVGLARFGPGPQTRAMTFLSLSLGQLAYALTCQRSDPAKLRLERLFANRNLDGALVISGGLAVLPFFVPGLRRLLRIAPLDAGAMTVGLLGAAAPAGAVLARRGVTFLPETVEVKPCATS